ncbi:MAG TPA: GreA/GreB family elongation factor [Bryobacteraceae bacterium]|jgi:transcription elongation factor GreB
MSKAFTNESADSPEDDLIVASRETELPLTAKNYTTPAGLRRLVEEFEQLTQTERPTVAALASHAAATSQQLDVQTHKRRLREIDWRIQYLQQRIDRAEVIDPAKRTPVDQVFFGATVTYSNVRGEQRTVSIVGVEESDATRNLVSFVSPLAKALLRAHTGDVVPFERPDGVEDLEILDITYREIP